MAPLKQQPKTLLDPLVKVAGALGVIQGCTWTILSLIGIIAYHTDFINVESSSINVGFILYQLYFNDSTIIDSYNVVIASKQLSYFSYLYLVLSLCWFIISSILLKVTTKNKKDKNYDQTVLAWTVITSIISLLDIILLCLLSYDYNQVVKFKVDENIVGEATEILKMTFELILVTIGVLMTIVARGFLLWIVNLVFIVILGKHWYQRHNEVKSNRPPINAFATGSKPPWALDTSSFDNTDSNSYTNGGFRDENNIAPFSPRRLGYEDEKPPRIYNSNIQEQGRGRSNNGDTQQGGLKKPVNNNDSFWNDRNNQGRNPNGSVPTSRLYNEPNSTHLYQQPSAQPFRTAKIGRQTGQRSPPLNVNTPYIPDPDYSPPGSPRVRGVLRPKSNYVY